jgi:hypothetical protein
MDTNTNRVKSLACGSLQTSDKASRKRHARPFDRFGRCGRPVPALDTADGNERDDEGNQRRGSDHLHQPQGRKWIEQSPGDAGRQRESQNHHHPDDGGRGGAARRINPLGQQHQQRRAG